MNNPLSCLHCHTSPSCFCSGTCAHAYADLQAEREIEALRAEVAELQAQLADSRIPTTAPDSDFNLENS